MLNKRLNRILISLALTIVCLVAYYLLVFEIVEKTGSNTGIPAVFTGLMVFAILDFFFVLIMDQGAKTSRSGANFKNGLYKVLTSLEFVVAAIVVLCGALDYTDITHSDMQLPTLMFVAGFVGTAIVHSTVKIAVYTNIYHGRLPRALFPFVHIGCTLIGYVVGVIVCCLGLLAPFLYGIANVVVFIVAVVVFCKLGYFDAGITENYNTTYSDDSPFSNASPARTNKRRNNTTAKKGNTTRKTLNTFDKKPATSQRSRNSLAYNEIDRKLRSYLATISKTLSATSPLDGATIKVTHLWEDVGYNVMLRFHISYNTSSSSMEGLDMETWSNHVSSAILAFRDSYDSQIRLAIGHVGDLMRTIIQRDDPYYKDNWFVDADFAEDLVID